MSTRSERILHFIGGFPQFTRRCGSSDDQYVVRLSDGARYSLPNDPADRDAGDLVVYWRDAAKAEQVDGAFLAELLIVDVSTHNHALGREHDVIATAKDLLSHFEWKTTDEAWAPQPNLPELSTLARLRHWGSNPVTWRRALEAITFTSIGVVLRSLF